MTFFKSKLRAFSFILAILICGTSLSAISEAAVIFLLIEPGSRPGAMGQAYVAQAEGAIGNYWNTGALAFNRKSEVSWMHTNWLGDVDGINDMYIEYIGWDKYYKGIGTLGASVTYLTYGEQTKTNANGDELGTFSSYELALGLSYAKQISENTGLGIQFKYILSDLSPEGTGETEVDTKGRGMSWAFDFGLKQRNVNPSYILYSPVNAFIGIYNFGAFLAGTDGQDYFSEDWEIKKLDFGLNLQNLGPDISFINEEQEDPLPLNFRMGLSYRLLEEKYNRLTINADMNKLLANSAYGPIERIWHCWYDDDSSVEMKEIIYNVGAEYIYLNLLALRAGYISDRAGKIEGASFGIGVQVPVTKTLRLDIDFAMQEAGELTDYNKTFSFGAKF
ncbi:MAG: hypothetical protein CSB55_07685 [Candidatus Cloacimonadota bacterium]|nr:MAG: hypothetical protein CSB55_07685 [Candidatus Cloacimonadota bacterium]